MRHELFKTCLFLFPTLFCCLLFSFFFMHPWVSPALCILFLLDKCIFESETPLLAWNKAHILSLSCQLQPSLPTLSIFQSSYYFSSLPLQIPSFPWSFAYIHHSRNTRDSLLCLIQHFKCFDWETVFILLSKKIFISVNKITFLYNFRQLSSY